MILEKATSKERAEDRAAQTPEQRRRWDEFNVWQKENARADREKNGIGEYRTADVTTR